MMSSSTSFAAQILESSASAFAGSSASLLLEQQPEVAKRFAPSALKDWQAHLLHRVLELSAALSAEEPKLFSARVQWEAEAFRSRGLDDEDLRSGLACLRKVLQEELPATAGDVVAEYFDAALEALDEVSCKDVGLNPSNPLERRALQYLEAALEGDGRQAIDLVVESVNEGVSIRDAYEILLLAQREVGRMWHLGDFEISEEHLVTSTTERATSILAQMAPRENKVNKTVITAAVAENRHGLAVRVLADFFEIAGWRSICLGADTPVSELAAAVVYFNADLLALSVALPTQLKATRATIDAVRALPGRGIKVLVGGGALHVAPRLWKWLGADGSIEEVEGAVILGGRLVGLTS